MFMYCYALEGLPLGVYRSKEAPPAMEVCGGWVLIFRTKAAAMDQNR